MLRAGRSTTQASAEPKRPRHAGGSGGDADDRLSALPDDLLHAIMSRLKAQQTVQTCMLSTRWRHLWRAVPCLDVDEQELGADRNLRNFVTNLLSSHDVALLEEFRVHALMTADPWVRRAIGQDDAWPCRLKRLHLSYLTNLKLPDLASHISSRCPALEDVRLEYCMFWLTTNTKIVSSSLKKLVIHGEYMAYHAWAYDDDDDETFALTIDAPALVSLCLGAEEPDVIVDVSEPHTMPSLVDASIRLCMSIDDDDYNLHPHYRHVPTTPYESGLLAALYNVTSLHLSHFDVLLLPNEDYVKFPVFENLRTLYMDVCDISHDFMGLEPYLRNSRNLQKLTLRRCKVLNYEPRNEVMERIHSYSENPVDFKCENLRLSEIIYKDGDASVHLLVKVLVGMWKNLPNNKIEFTKVK